MEEAKSFLLKRVWLVETDKETLATHPGVNSLKGYSPSERYIAMLLTS